MQHATTRTVLLLVCLLLPIGLACSDEPAHSNAVKANNNGAPTTLALAADTNDDTTATNIRFDWPGWRGPSANGMSAETDLIHEFGSNGPEILWRVELGTGFSGLSVVENRLYTLYGRDSRERLASFDADTGNQLWEIELDDDFAQGRSYGPRSTPLIHQNRVYAVGASGEIRCVDARFGDVVWAFNIYEKYSMRLHDEGLSCSPILDENRILLAAGTSVFAFDTANGELIWRALEEPMNHSTPALEKLDGRTQLIVLSAENLVGLDAKTGNEYWRHPQRGVNCVTPVVLPDDHIFTAASYGFGCQLIRVRNNRSKQIYKNNELATHHATAVQQSDALYGFHDRPGIFKSIDYKTGKKNWVSRSPGKGKLIIADDQLIILTEAGELVLGPVATDGFQATAKAKLLNGTCYTAPTLANGKLYLRSNQEMICVNMKP